MLDIPEVQGIVAMMMKKNEEKTILYASFEKM